jgi:O-acetyl-ADP-ribose deacetylase (regulator of RNase III)
MTKVTIELLKGDITERETDALVNTANTMLILGSGLGGAIKAKGGASIAKECAKLGPVKAGEAVITGAGGLKAKYVIHGALTEFDGFIQEENIAKTLLSCLRLANRRRLKSIAVPDLSIGLVRFEPERCAVILLTALKQFVEKENRYLRLIEIVLWDIETLRIYKTVYKEIFTQDSK